MKDAAHKGVRIGRYQIVQHIATGGMGAVYKALDERTNQLVALKVLPPELASRPNMLHRFCQEARSAAKLRHDNIITIREFGEVNDTYYLALEFVDGIDLLKYINDRESLDPREALEFVIQATHALEHASEKGIVHRDIKPANFLITEKDGKPLVKLADMGLAREISEQDFRLTMAGTTVGTIDYMAPEQARDSGAADFRSDIYSLGCSWYHMLTGRPPFAEGSLTERLLKHMAEVPADIRPSHFGVTDEMMRVIWKMLAKKPMDRYQTPAELLEDLANLKKPGQPAPVASPKTATKEDLTAETRPDVGPPLIPPEWENDLLTQKPRKQKIRDKAAVEPAPTALMPSDAHRLAAAGQFQRAEEVLLSGNYDYAFRLLREACKLDPGHILYRQAFRQAQKARYHDNGKGSALAWLTTLPLKAKLKNAKRNADYVKMLSIGERILTRNPWDLGTQMDMATAAEELGSKNMAIWFLEQAQESHPNNIPVNRALAYLYEQRGSTEQAMALWQIIKDADPQDNEARQKVKDLAASDTIAKSLQGVKEKRFGHRAKR
jgi:serine/threonine protein kinase